MSDSSELNQFFTASNQELIATVNRLDKLIGCNHWLTVGTYKETLLKKTLRRGLFRKLCKQPLFIKILSPGM